MATLLSFMDLLLENSVEGAQRTLSIVREPETFKQLLTLKKTLAIAEKNPGLALAYPLGESHPEIDELTELDQIEQHLQTVIDGNLPYLTSHLDVSGADLIKIGFNPDQTVGKTLNSLLFAVISGEIVNNRKNLLNFSKKFKNSVDDLREVP